MPRPKICPQGQGQALDLQGQCQGQGFVLKARAKDLTFEAKAKAKDLKIVFEDSVTLEEFDNFLNFMAFAVIFRNFFTE